MPLSIAMPMRAEERTTIAPRQVLSLTDVVYQTPKYLATAETLQISLRNPWGTDGAGNDGGNEGIVTVNDSQFAANFSILSYSLT